MRLRWAKILLARAAGDASGATLVEFGFIGPILLLMFLATIEIPRAYTLNKRVDQVASTLVDLLSRHQYDDLQPVFAIATAVGEPYDMSAASIVLTTAGTYGLGTVSAARVCSSAQRNGTQRSIGSWLGSAPPSLTNHGDRFVMVEVSVRYRAVVPLFPSLTTWYPSQKKILPVRNGKVYNGQQEVVLPGGKPCPFL